MLDKQKIGLIIDDIINGSGKSQATDAADQHNFACPD
jgi:hypothetical protein